MRTVAGLSAGDGNASGTRSRCGRFEGHRNCAVLSVARKELPTLVVWEKSPATATVSVIEAVPGVFVSVIVCEALVLPTVVVGKVRLLTEKEIVPSCPVPERLMDCGLFAALSLTFTWPVRAPIPTGSKITLMVQLLEGASDAPQLLVAMKSDEVLLMLVIANARLPVFFNVADLALVGDPSLWVPNEIEFIDKFAIGAVPVPERLTDC